jgi:hypothetical protein
VTLRRQITASDDRLCPYSHYKSLERTADAFHTLGKALLRRGGIIIANELTTKTDFLTLTFGLTDGWWLYDDPQWRMPGAYRSCENTLCTRRNGH